VRAAVSPPHVVEQRTHAAGRQTPRSSHWLIGSVVALSLLGALALGFATLSGMDGVAAGVTRARSRLRSRGLSAGRIDVGERADEPDDRGIHYRE
jgi:hypothetical protein